MTDRVYSFTTIICFIAGAVSTFFSDSFPSALWPTVILILAMLVALAAYLFRRVKAATQCANEQQVEEQPQVEEQVKVGDLMKASSPEEQAEKIRLVVASLVTNAPASIITVPTADLMAMPGIGAVSVNSAYAASTYAVLREFEKSAKARVSSNSLNFAIHFGAPPFSGGDDDELQEKIKVPSFQLENWQGEGRIQ